MEVEVLLGREEDEDDLNFTLAVLGAAVVGRQAVTGSENCASCSHSGSGIGGGYHVAQELAKTQHSAAKHQLKVAALAAALTLNAPSAASRVCVHSSYPQLYFWLVPTCNQPMHAAAIPVVAFQYRPQRAAGPVLLSRGIVTMARLVAFIV